MSESLILRVREGKLVEKTSRRGKPEEVVKELIPEILNEWDPKASDLSIVKYSVKELLKEDRVKGFIYLISYKDVWSDGTYKDREVMAVTSGAVEERINELLSVLEAYTLQK